jgi:hypothetical protein
VPAVSPLLFVYLCGLSKSASALLAAAATVGCQVAVLVRTRTGMDWRRGQGRGGTIPPALPSLRVAGALVMLLPSLGSATFPTSFVGGTARSPDSAALEDSNQRLMLYDTVAHSTRTLAELAEYSAGTFPPILLRW